MKNNFFENKESCIETGKFRVFSWRNHVNVNKLTALNNGNDNRNNKVYCQWDISFQKSIEFPIKFHV